MLFTVYTVFTTVLLAITVNANTPAEKWSAQDHETVNIWSINAEFDMGHRTADVHVRGPNDEKDEYRIPLDTSKSLTLDPENGKSDVQQFQRFPDTRGDFNGITHTRNTAGPSPPIYSNTPSVRGQANPSNSHLKLANYSPASTNSFPSTKKDSETEDNINTLITRNSTEDLWKTNNSSQQRDNPHTSDASQSSGPIPVAVNASIQSPENHINIPEKRNDANVFSSPKIPKTSLNIPLVGNVPGNHSDIPEIKNGAVVFGRPDIPAMSLGNIPFVGNAEETKVESHINTPQADNGADLTRGSNKILRTRDNTELSTSGDNDTPSTKKETDLSSSDAINMQQTVNDEEELYEEGSGNTSSTQVEEPAVDTHLAAEWEDAASGSDAKEADAEPLEMVIGTEEPIEKPSNKTKDLFKDNEVLKKQAKVTDEKAHDKGQLNTSLNTIDYVFRDNKSLNKSSSGVFRDHTKSSDATAHSRKHKLSQRHDTNAPIIVAPSACCKGCEAPSAVRLLHILAEAICIKVIGGLWLLFFVIVYIRFW